MGCGRCFNDDDAGRLKYILKIIPSFTFNTLSLSASAFHSQFGSILNVHAHSPPLVALTLPARLCILYRLFEFLINSARILYFFHLAFHADQFMLSI
jgi:hypothetical protein